MKEYNDLAAEAAQADEDLLDAEANLKARQGELAKATSDLTEAGASEEQAKATMTQFEGQLVDIRPMRGDGHFIGARRLAG